MSEYLTAYRAAQAAARELVTLRLLDEGAALHASIDEHLRELREVEHGLPAFIGILVESIAEQWDSVEDFSTHVIAALAEDDTQEPA